MKKIFYTAALLLSVGSACAQDWHYSQFYAAPLNANPGNCGAHNADIRVYTLYRMQWFTVTNPYKTFNIALDGPIFKKRMLSDDFFAAGLNISSDNDGPLHYKTQSYNAVASFTKFIGGRQKHNITLGYTIGYNIKSVALGGAKWDSQYNPVSGTYDPSFGTAEPGGGGGYMDMSTGIVWNFRTDHLFRSALGFSFHHFTAPRVSVLGRNERLYPKIGVQWNIGYKLSETSNTTLLPSIIAYQQGSSLLLNGGLNVKYVLEEASRYTDNQTDKAVYFGVFYRFRDAIYVTFRYDIKEFSIGAAYDVTASSLTPTTKSVGGFELNLQYKGIFKNKNSRKASVRFL
ncbi:MAG: PorP/SprF family type IX secretion system membrane protein [Bacteroidia bacterium]